MTTVNVGIGSALSPVWKILIVSALRAAGEALIKIADRIED